MPRLIAETKTKAELVKNQLRSLESLHKSILSAPTDVIEQAILNYSNNKIDFKNHVYPALRQRTNRIFSGTKEEASRNGVLNALRVSLASMGISISPIESPPFRIEPGGE
jgi:hypothetical protein